MVSWEGEQTRENEREGRGVKVGAKVLLDLESTSWSRSFFSRCALNFPKLNCFRGLGDKGLWVSLLGVPRRDLVSGAAKSLLSFISGTIAPGYQRLSWGIPSCPGKSFILFFSVFYFSRKFLGEFVAWAVVDRSIKFPDSSLLFYIACSLFLSSSFTSSSSITAWNSFFFAPFIHGSLIFRFTAYWSRFVVPFSTYFHC